MIHTFMLQTSKRDQMIDITSRVEEAMRSEAIEEGVVVVYCPHTTAGITINENADPDVVHDMLMRLDEVYPWEHPQYLHAEGNSASHLKASTMGPSQTVLITRENSYWARGKEFTFVSLMVPVKGLFWLN